MWSIIGVMLFIILFLSFLKLWITLAIFAFFACLGALIFIGIPLIVSIFVYAETQSIRFGCLAFVGVFSALVFITRYYFNKL